MGRILIIVGVMLVVVGLIWTYGSKFGLGELPGDIQIKGERYSFYFPLMTSIILSILLSAVLWLFNHFRD